MFKAIKINSERYVAIVFSCSYDLPLDNLSYIQSQLLSLNVQSGRILFDTLLSNGNHEDRFIEATFAEGEFVKGTFKIVSLSKKSDERIKCSEFFRKSDLDYNRTLLSVVQKRIIMNGYTL